MPPGRETGGSGRELARRPAPQSKLMRCEEEEIFRVEFRPAPLEIEDVKSEIIEPPTLDESELIQSLLRFQPAGAGKSSEDDRGASALCELGKSLRRALEVVLQIGEAESLSFRLGESATEDNLVMALAWALARPFRRVRELPPATLELSENGVTDWPAVIHRRLRQMSIAELVAEHRASPKTRRETRRRDRAPVAHRFPAARFVATMFGVAPTTLFNFKLEALPDLRRLEPDEMGRDGIERLMKDVIAQFTIMRERQSTTAQLMSERDARDADIREVRAAHVATLLAAALFAADGHEIEFMAPRAWSPERAAALRETAKGVYRDYSEEALRGFELICDGYVHFGHATNWTIAQRHLVDVARECDPELQRMPYCVALILSLKDVGEVLAALGPAQGSP